MAGCGGGGGVGVGGLHQNGRAVKSAGIRGVICKSAAYGRVHARNLHDAQRAAVRARSVVIIVVGFASLSVLSLSDLAKLSRHR